MKSLIDLIRRYRRAETREEELKIAEEIITHVSPKLEGYLVRACRRPSLAEDLLQETLIKIYRNLSNFEGHTDGEALSWCYTIARNTLCAHFRTNKIEEHLEPLDADSLWKVVEASAENEAISPEDRQDLEEALALLAEAKPPCRGYLWSYYIRELGYKEIAEIYGLSYDAARIKLRRCLKLAIELAAKHFKT